MNFKTQPKQHQIEAFNKSKNKEVFAYLCEMGTGKTKMCIDDMSNLFNQGLINAVVVLAPKGVYTNWVGELSTHCPDEHIAAVWDSSKINSKQEQSYFTSFCIDQLKDNYVKYLIMNVEALSRAGKALTYLENFMKYNRCAVVIDEATCIKNHKAKRTKAIIKLKKLSRYRRILTGSPITNSPLNLYSQFEFLSKLILGFSSYYAFRNYIAIMKTMNLGTRTFNVVQGYDRDALFDITERIQPHSVMYKKSECLDLPEKIYYKRYVDLSPEQMEDYNKLKDELILLIEQDNVMTVNNVLTKLLKLHQIACGFINHDEGVKVYENSKKIEELGNTIDEMSGKIIIWANYIHNIKEIESFIKKEYGENSVVTYYGETSAEDRDIAKQRFNNDPEYRFFIGNPQTAGYGLTLVAAENEIYFSNSYDIEKRQQSEDRAHRIGQTKNVNIVDIIARNTVDETIMKSLKTKKSLQDIVMVDGWTKALNGGRL